MIELGVEYGAIPGLSAEKVRAQLELLVHDEIFRSSKRSVAFLRYIVEQTLNGFADQIKERAIGAEVFGRTPLRIANQPGAGVVHSAFYFAGSRAARGSGS
jgi:hypothetical protein